MTMEVTERELLSEILESKVAAALSYVRTDMGIPILAVLRPLTGRDRQHSVR